MRRSIAILVLTCFVTSSIGLTYAIHLRFWHEECGEDSHHDNNHCPVFQAMVAASQAEVGNGPVLVVEADLWDWETAPVVQAPRLTSVPQPIEPRAPPAFTL